MSVTGEKTRARELATEQAHVDVLYAHLDAERRTTAERLKTSLQQTGRTPQERTERDVAATTYSERMNQLDGVEAGLCFGRIDRARSETPTPPSDSGDEETLYIGRIGLFDAENDYEPLLLDWRAPASRPFYLATAASPHGVRRRRHLRTELRQVVDYDDEVLDLTAFPDTAGGGERESGIAGEAALLAALNRQRTGEMADIVATIQAEQDAIIRSPLPGLLVVQGGPGTGKTAVALHRAAYLLYEHRDILSHRGVLVLGPNETFLNYISQVLPSLGESGVLLATTGELFPGARVRATDTARAAEIKGRRSMVDVLAAAVADRQRVPDAAVEVEVDDDTVVVEPSVVAKARDAARATDAPHNVARRVFVETVVALVAEQMAERLTDAVTAAEFEAIALADGEDPDAEVLDDADVADIEAELTASAEFSAALEQWWPQLTPPQLLASLLTDAERLKTAGQGILDADDQQEILRERAIAWTAADIALLDELVEHLGVDSSSADAKREREERERRAYAEGVLDIMEQDEEIADEERLRVADVLDAELLAEREQAREALTVAERAAADRNWAFGHVIVDEAQELTAMDWRMIMRRCPSRSMTLVGDIAQTSAAGGAPAWQDVLEPYAGQRWRLTELTVNYRTPAEIMDVAAGTLARLDPSLTPPRSVRATGVQPWDVTVDDVVAEAADAAARELEAAGQGTVAVIAPDELVEPIRQAVAHDRLSVLTVAMAKGLEFDGVIVVEPDLIAGASARGLSDLYVAQTRATQRLGIIRGRDARTTARAESGPDDTSGRRTR